MELEIKNTKRITSLEISELTGKRHGDLMRDMRKMEAAWEKVNGRKFALVDYKDAKGQLRPMYELSKTECLYIATKFNDEARARLILRWESLEEKEQKPMTILDFMESSVKALRKQEARIENVETEVKELKEKVEYKDQNQRFVEIELERNSQKEDIKDLYN